MKRRSVSVEQTSNLFSFFKPVSSPAASNATSSKKTPSKARGLKKQKFDSATPNTNDQSNGEVESRDAECTAMATETTLEATPITSGRKRPHPPDNDEDSEGEIGVRKVSFHGDLLPWH